MPKRPLKMSRSGFISRIPGRRRFTTLIIGSRIVWMRFKVEPEGTPIIAVFFGIVIRMFYKEHEPPHFHAEHQSQSATFDFDGKILAGDIQSKTAVRLIRAWAIAHRAELEANWANMKAGKALEKIAPLD